MTKFFALFVFLVFLGENDISAHALSEETTLSPKTPRQEAAPPISEAQQQPSPSNPAYHPVVENLKKQIEPVKTPSLLRKNKGSFNPLTRQPKESRD